MFTKKDLRIYQDLISNKKFEELVNYSLKRISDGNTNNVWHLSYLSHGYYECFEYDKGFEKISSAILLNPYNILTMWYLAGFFAIQGNNEYALITYKEIVKIDVDYKVYELHGGRCFVDSIINDSKYQISKTYYESNNKVKSNKMFDQYLLGLKKGVDSNYSADDRSEWKMNGTDQDVLE